MSVNPWNSLEVDAAFNHYREYVRLTSMSYSDDIYKKYFPNYDIYKLIQPGYRVAEYVHINYFKQHGTNDIHHNSWKELSEWYHRVIMVGTKIAYKLIEYTINSYNIDLQCNNVQSMLINPLYSEKMEKIFIDGYNADPMLFKQFNNIFYRSMQSIRGECPASEELVITILYRNFMHGYLGLLLANTYITP